MMLTLTPTRNLQCCHLWKKMALAPSLRRPTTKLHESFTSPCPHRNHITILDLQVLETTLTSVDIVGSLNLLFKE